MSINDVSATLQPGVAYHLGRVTRKLATGQYRTESVACLCGSTDAVPVCTADRYGLPHRMVFCRHCGVLYASPRMTEDALRAFYAHDYRAIYDYGMTEAQRAESRQLQLENGLGVQELADEYGVRPRTVLELGCNEGGMLQAFLDSGATCLGVDWDAQQVATGCLAGRPLVQGGIEVLEAAGLKADLILASHILEHVPHLSDMLTRLRALLAPNGMLFVAVPTVVMPDRRHLWQNAHCWQFSARTLNYVMECHGFQDVYLDEAILSLWKPVERYRPLEDVNTHEVYRLGQILSGKRPVMPIVKTVNKFERTVRLSHLTHALAAGRPDMTPLIGSQVGQTALIVCGGPSIDQEVETLRRLQGEGALLFTIERMLPWCLAHDLMPDYVVTMDAHEDVVDAFPVLPESPVYLVALQCHPSVLQRLQARTVYTFTTEQKDLNQSDLMEQAQIAQWTKVNSGSSVSLCAMNLAMVMGIRQLHLFGFDCQFTDAPYAQGIAGVGDIIERLQIEIAGYPDRLFTTTVPYYGFAQQFIQGVELFHRLGYLDSVTVHGESLVKYLAHPHRALRES